MQGNPEGKHWTKEEINSICKSEKIIKREGKLEDEKASAYLLSERWVIGGEDFYGEGGEGFRGRKGVLTKKRKKGVG